MSCLLSPYPNERVAAEALGAAYHHMATAIAANLLIPSVIAATLNDSPHKALIGAWTGAFWLFALVLFLTRRHYYQDPLRDRRWRHWEATLVRLNIVAGLLWGSAAASHVIVSTAEAMFIMVVAMGVVAGAIANVGVSGKAYLALTLLALLPHSLLFLATGGRVPVAESLLLLGFVGTVLIHARAYRRQVLAAILLRLENQDLVAEKARQTAIAEQASLAKSRFLSAASHDLRQPVHALGLFVHRLQQEPLSPLQRELTGHIETAAAATQELLNGLMDISRLDSHTQNVERRVFPLRPLLERLSHEFQAKAGTKGLSLRLRASALWVDSDAVLLERILANFLSNALRYTAQGGVLLALRPRAGKVRLAVYDTGIGIAPHEQKMIFGEYYQVSNSTRDRHKGLGLGLAIVDGLARLLDHPVSLRSRPGRGSCFAIDLPLAPAPAVSQRPSAPQPHRLALAVLIIDDDAAVRLSTRLLLEGWGCQVLEAANGREAEACLHPALDVILCDYRLPGEETGAALLPPLQALTRAACFLISGEIDALALQAAQEVDIPLLAKPLSPMRLRAVLAGVATRMAVASEPSLIP